MKEKESNQIIAVVPLGRMSRADINFAARQGIVKNAHCDVADAPVELNFRDLDYKGRPKPGWGRD